MEYWLCTSTNNLSVEEIHLVGTINNFTQLKTCKQSRRDQDVRRTSKRCH